MDSAPKDDLSGFLPQCCDAQGYLQRGKDCAKGGDGACYDALRPMGSSLWFSLPFRLGLPLNSLIVAHILLFFISVTLSSLALSRWTTKLSSPAGSPLKWPHRPLLWALNALVHWIFFYPVMLNTLSDAPAAFFAVNAIWILLLNQIKRSYALLGVAGVMLGLAAWIRVFYLYPVLFVLTVFLLLWARDRDRRVGELAFLLALVPIFLQFNATFQRHDYVSYLERSQSRKWSSIHLNSDLMGYDTLIDPIRRHKWPSGCDVRSGLAGSWDERNVSGAICLIAKRSVFYFGSYSPRTYVGGLSQNGGEAWEMREWSNGLLFLSALAVLFFILFFAKLCSVSAGARSGIVATSLPALVVGEGLLVIPEQRFVIVFHVVTWSVFLAFITVFVARVFELRVESSADRRPPPGSCGRHG